MIMAVSVGTMVFATNDSESNSNSVECSIPNSVKNSVQRFLTYYYNALSQYENEEYGNFCITNANTSFFKSFIQYDAAAKSMIGCTPSAYVLTVDYKSYTYENHQHRVHITVDYSFIENNSNTISSSICNIGYDFEINDNFMISNIDSDFVAYQRMKTLSQSTSQSTIQRTTNNIFDIELQAIKQGVELENELNVEDAERLLYADVGNNLYVEEVYERAATTYSYNRSVAGQWALDHVNDGSNGYFQKLSANCQNFVSQCVWAGYGGPTAGSGNVAQNILNDVRMVSGSSGWYGCPSGYNDFSNAWISVNSFWNFAVGNTGKGPKATGENNGGLYTGIYADEINVGDVLQLRNGSSGNYAHSVICSYVPDECQAHNYSAIKICSNTSDYRNVSLKTYMIDYFGGDNCYMRRMIMKSAQFDS